MTLSDIQRIHRVLNSSGDSYLLGEITLALTVYDAYMFMVSTGDWLFGQKFVWPEVGRRGRVLGINFVVVPDPPLWADPPALDIDHD